MSDGTGDSSRTAAVSGNSLVRRCCSMIIAVPALIWALVSGVASIFGLLGITLFDGRSVFGSPPEWALRRTLPSSEPAAGAIPKAGESAGRPIQDARRAAEKSGPDRLESGVSLGMQPTTYAALPPAHVVSVTPVAPAPDSPFPLKSSGNAVTYLFNNREVSLQMVGDLVQVRYLDVRKEMADNGVRTGDLFVEFRLGGDLGGTARLRSGRCGVAPYDVSGVSEDNYRVIRLHGEARKFDSNCRLTNERFPMSIVLEKL